mmetsp:Transcript_18175/g.28949  ORF Transcript_18175/g.28949 Transcript_18175/m.28949 type:complete len:520 (-) Transcript_18175:48-1607(-)
MATPSSVIARIEQRATMEEDLDEMEDDDEEFSEDPPDEPNNPSFDKFESRFRGSEIGFNAPSQRGNLRARSVARLGATTRYFVGISSDKVNILDARHLRRAQPEAFSSKVHAASHPGTTTTRTNAGGGDVGAEDLEEDELESLPSSSPKGEGFGGRGNAYDASDPFIDDGEIIDIKKDDSHDAMTKFIVHASQTGEITEHVSPGQAQVCRKRKRKPTSGSLSEADLPGPALDALKTLKETYSRVVASGEKPRNIPTALDPPLLKLENSKRALGKDRARIKALFDQVNAILPWGRASLKNRMRTLYESQLAGETRAAVDQLLKKLKAKIVDQEKNRRITDSKGGLEGDSSTKKVKWKLLAPDLIEAVRLRELEVAALNRASSKSKQIDWDKAKRDFFHKICLLWPDGTVTTQQLRSVYRRYTKPVLDNKNTIPTPKASPITKKRAIIVEGSVGAQTPTVITPQPSPKTAETLKLAEKPSPLLDNPNYKRKRCMLSQEMEPLPPNLWDKKYFEKSATATRK